MFSRLLSKTIKGAGPLILGQKQRKSTLSLNHLKMNKDLLEKHKSLPRLPVPPLHPSLEIYLRSVRPLLTEEEYSNTSKIVKEFSSPDGIGIKLYSELLEKSKRTENWVCQWWRDAYLSERNSLLTNSTIPNFSNFQDFSNEESYLRYAAKMVSGFLDFKSLIDNHILNQDVMSGQPLDMTQYFNVFGSCRIPGTSFDFYSFTHLDDKPPQHIIVVHNNHFFSCKVFGDDNKPLNETQLLTQFKQILDKSQEPNLSIGILTTLNRDKWFKSYEELRKYDPVNAVSIEAIQKSIFILCLDKPVTNKDVPNRRAKIQSYFMHGGGVELNSGNRWFDKTLQVIVNRDGSVGFVYEHSAIDGQVFQRIIPHVFNYIEKSERKTLSDIKSAPEPNKLRFKFPKKILTDIEDAKKDLKCLIDDFDMSSLTFNNYGTDFPKSQRLSPDGFIQMALQLAFFKIHGKPSATYETASTRKFLLGRTDVIRSTSVESVDFCRKMVDKSASTSSKTAALKRAIHVHKEYTLRAMNGLAIDRLLFGLKSIALESRMRLPVLFEDAGYRRSTHFTLSTSQVPVKCGTSGNFRVLVPDGYGCFYNPQPLFLILNSSASNSCPNTSADDFLNGVANALIEMRDIITVSQTPKNYKIK